MPFLAMGIFLLLMSILTLRKGIRENSRELVVGSAILFMIALILIFIFGLFYRYGVQYT